MAVDWLRQVLMGVRTSTAGDGDASSDVDQDRLDRTAAQARNSAPRGWVGLQQPGCWQSLMPI